MLETHAEMVMTVGGGIVSEPETFNLLLLNCFTVWVKATPDEHMARVVAQGDFRPMQGNAEAMDDLTRILDAREPLYRKADVDARHVGRGARSRASPSCARPSRPDATTKHEENAMAQAAAILPPRRRGEAARFVTYDTHPDRYAHWKLAFDGPVATLALDVDEDGGIGPGYKLKLNSYDLGVDIELHDALQRIRFEHPEVRSVVVTSGKRAHLLLRRQHLHARALDARVEGELLQVHQRDAQRHRGFEPALRPQVPRRAATARRAGGGYELALACDEILLIDDRSSAVSLPEVPLLGVLPGTGGLTRVTDKRKVRRDHADIFCTLVEGVRAQRAKEWRLVDDLAKPQQFAATVQRARAGARRAERPARATRRASR